jgi:beta-1,4-N-acetylglucosaminyltransferase
MFSILRAPNATPNLGERGPWYATDPPSTSFAPSNRASRAASSSDLCQAQAVRSKMRETWMMLEGCILAAFGFLCLLLYRIKKCLPSSQRNTDSPLAIGSRLGVKTMVFFGSGGHTMEMCRLITKLDAAKYHPVCFAIGHTDTTSVDKVRAMNISLEKSARWLRIYRNREVKQSWLSTLFTAVWSLIQGFYVIWRYRPQLLICNGPGTCLSLCYSCFLLNVLGLSSTKIVFVESFCRVQALSLTGKLLLPIADKFIVQWPELVAEGSRMEYIGTLC